MTLAGEVTLEEPLDAGLVAGVAVVGVTEVDVELVLAPPYWFPTKTTRPPVATMAVMAVTVVADRIRCAPMTRGFERFDIVAPVPFGCASMVADGPKGECSGF